MEPKMFWNILLHYVKICHCDWFSKKLNGQQLGKRYRQDFWGWRGLEKKKKGGVTSQMQNKQDGHNGDEMTCIWKNIDFKIWANLSYKSQLETNLSKDQVFIINDKSPCLFCKLVNQKEMYINGQKTIVIRMCLTYV